MIFKASDESPLQMLVVRHSSAVKDSLVSTVKNSQSHLENQNRERKL